MTEWLFANWQIPAVIIGLLVIVAPRIAHLLPSLSGWRGGSTEPSQDELVHAYRLLLDHLDDAPARDALTESVWPAIGRYRP